MAKSTQAHIEASKRYRKKSYTFLQVTLRNGDTLPQRIDAARARTGESRSSYIYNAIKTRLQSDGIPEEVQE